jgi:hypothetical protein
MTAFRVSAMREEDDETLFGPPKRKTVFGGKEDSDSWR